MAAPRAVHVAYDPKQSLLPPCESAEDLILMHALEGTPANNPAALLMEGFVDTLGAIVSREDLMRRMKSAVFLSERMPGGMVDIGAGGVSNAFLDEWAPEKDYNLRGGEGGAGSGGSAGGGGAGGGSATEADDEYLSLAVKELVKATEGGEEVKWRLPVLPDLPLHTPAELRDYKFGIKTVKYMELLGDSTSFKIAEQLRKIQCLVRDATPYVFPRTGAPAYIKGDVLSNMELNAMALPLDDENSWREQVAPILPLDRCVIAHGPKALVTAGAFGVRADELDFAKVHAGLPPNRRAFSTFALDAIVKALMADAVALFEALPDMREDWAGVDSLHRNYSAAARLLAFNLIMVLHCWGVNHALVVCAPLRRLLLHVALCISDKVTVTSSRFQRQVGGGAVELYDEWCMYLHMFGVSGGRVLVPLGQRINLPSHFPFLSTPLSLPTPPPARPGAHAGEPRCVHQQQDGREAPDGRGAACQDARHPAAPQGLNGLGGCLDAFPCSGGPVWAKVVGRGGPEGYF